jgi:hypothetical protein
MLFGLVRNFVWKISIGMVRIKSKAEWLSACAGGKNKIGDHHVGDLQIFSRPISRLKKKFFLSLVFRSDLRGELFLFWLVKQRA